MAEAACAARALLPSERRLLRAHAGVRACATYVGEEIWRSYFKFAFDRNPWDRQVSWYFYKTKSKRVSPELRALHDEPAPRLCRQLPASTRSRTRSRSISSAATRGSRRSNAALAKAGVAGCGLSVPHTNVTPNKDTERSYRSYYSDRTRERVADWYRPEIALLGYGF